MQSIPHVTKQIGANIRRLRFDSRPRLTQGQLAKEIGTSAAVVSLWESGKRAPSAVNIIRLATFFAVPTDTILAFKWEFKKKG